MNHAIVERTTAALLVDHLELHDGDIGSVGTEALRILDGRHVEMMRFAGGLNGISAHLAPIAIANGLEASFLERNVAEREEILIASLTPSQRTAVEEEFYLVARGDHLLRELTHGGVVVPMTNDIGAVALGFYPAVPHHLMHEERILRQAHRIGDTAGAIVRLTAEMGVGVGEDNLRTTAVHTATRARSLEPVVVPAAHHLDGEGIHVVIVVGSRSITIERPSALFVIRIAPRIPIFAQAFVATILHLPHRVLRRLVHIEHLATILGFVDIEHLTRADGTSAKGIVLVANGLEFEHVIAGNGLVAALVEEDAGIVAIVDDGIAHEFYTLLPATTLDVFLGIARRHRLDESHAVARLDSLLPRRDVHPAHEVASRLHLQPIGIVAEPRRHTHTHTGPLVRSALSVAMHHDDSIVEPDLAFGETSLTEARAGDDQVIRSSRRLKFITKIGLHRVEIAIPPRPEMQPLHFFRGLDNTRFPWLQGYESVTIETSYLITISIFYYDRQEESALFCVVVLHLTLHMNDSLVVSYVEVGGIDIGSRSAEVGIKRKCLIEQSGRVEPNILRNAAVVGVKVLVVPLEGRPRGTLMIVPTVVGAYCQYVLTLNDVRCQVEAKGHDSIL